MLGRDRLVAGAVEDKGRDSHRSQGAADIDLIMQKGENGGRARGHSLEPPCPASIVRVIHKAWSVHVYRVPSSPGRPGRLNTFRGAATASSVWPHGMSGAYLAVAKAPYAISAAPRFGWLAEK